MIKWKRVLGPSSNKIDIGFKSISILFYEPSAQKCPKLPKEYNIGPPLTVAIKSAPKMSIMSHKICHNCHNAVFRAQTKYCESQSLSQLPQLSQFVTKRNREWSMKHQHRQNIIRFKICHFDQFKQGQIKWNSQSPWSYKL